MSGFYLTLPRVSQRQTTGYKINGLLLIGTTRKSGTTLVGRYQDGEQTISVPANVPVVGVVPGEVPLAAGETAYAKTDKQADGTLTTHMILVISGPSSGNGK